MKINTKELVICSMFAAITAILAQIAIPIPFSTVPLTMQVFAVTISGLVLGAKKGFITQFIYVLLGAIGLPVFAQMSGGLGALFGYTGGFIMTFPLMALVVGYVSDKFNSIFPIIISMFLALLITYTFGTLWYSFIAGVEFKKGLMVCVVPFILSDIVKVIFASYIGLKVKNEIRKRALSC